MSNNLFYSLQLTTDRVTNVLNNLKKSLDNVNSSIELKLKSEIAEGKIKAIKQQILNLENSKVNLLLDSNLTEAKIKKVKADLEKLRTLDTSPQIDLKIATAEINLKKFENQLRSIKSKEVDIDIKQSNLQTDIRKVETDLRNLGQKAGDNFTKGFESRISNLQSIVNSTIGNVLSNGITNLVSASQSIVFGAFRKSEELTKLGLKYEVLLGSQEKAIERQAEIQRYAAQTPFEVGEITQADTVLQGFGIRSEKLLKNLGNASAVSGKGFSELALIIGQISQSKSVGNLNQLFSAGVIGKQDLIAQNIKFNLKTGEVESSVEELYNAVNRVIEKKFAGGTDKLNNTLSGQISTINDNLTQAFDTIFKGSGLAKVFLDLSFKVNDFLSKTDFSGFANIIKVFTEENANKSNLLFESLKNIKETLDKFVNFVGFDNFVRSIGILAAIGAGAGLLFVATSIIAIATAVAPFALLAGGLIAVVTAFDNLNLILTLLQPAFDNLSNAINSIFNYANGGEIVITALTQIWQTLTSAFETALPFITLIAGQLLFLGIQIGVVAQYAFTQLYPAILQIIQAFGNFIQAIQPVINLIITLGGIIINTLLAAFNFAFPIIAAVVVQLFVGISTAFAGIINVISGVVNFVVGVFTLDFAKAWKSLEQIFKGGVQIIIGIFQSITYLIKGVFDGIFLLFTSFDLAKKALDWAQGFLNSVKDKFTEAKNFILDIFKNIKLPEIRLPEIRLPEIPKFASGTNNFEGGLARFGESGREILRFPNGLESLVDRDTTSILPRGTRILNNSDTERYLRNNQVNYNNQSYDSRVNNNQSTNIYGSSFENRRTLQRLKFA